MNEELMIRYWKATHFTWMDKSLIFLGASRCEYNDYLFLSDLALFIHFNR